MNEGADPLELPCVGLRPPNRTLHASAVERLDTFPRRAPSLLGTPAIMEPHRIAFLHVSVRENQGIEHLRGRAVLGGQVATVEVVERIRPWRRTIRYNRRPS